MYLEDLFTALNPDHLIAILSAETGEILVDDTLPGDVDLDEFEDRIVYDMYAYHNVLIICIG